MLHFGQGQQWIGLSNLYGLVYQVTGKFIQFAHGIENELSGKFFAEIESLNFSRSFELNYTEDKDDKEQGILITYSRVRDDKLFYIEKDMKNEIYLQPSKSFPQYVVTDLTFNETKKIGALFHDMQYVGQKKTDDIFKLTGVVINRELLEKRMRDPTTKIEGEVIEGNYSIQNNNASLYILGDKIKSDNEYFLYATIDKDPENKNEYKSVIIQYLPEHKEPPEEGGDSDSDSDTPSDSDTDRGGEIYYIDSKYIKLTMPKKQNLNIYQ